MSNVNRRIPECAVAFQAIAGVQHLRNWLAFNFKQACNLSC